MLQRTSKETKLDQRLGDQRDGASRPSTSLGYFVSAASPFELAALPAPEWSMHIVITASFLGGWNLIYVRQRLGPEPEGGGGSLVNKDGSSFDVPKLVIRKPRLQILGASSKGLTGLFW